MATARTASKVISVTPDLAADSVAATTAYADKDVIGDHLTLTNVMLNDHGTAILQSIVLKSFVTTANLYDFWFLNAAPAAAYGNNNSAFALADTDLSKVIGVVSIVAADHNAADSLSTVATKMNIGLPLQAAVGTKNLYVIVIARGAVTFGAAGDLLVDFGFLQD